MFFSLRVGFLRLAGNIITATTYLVSSGMLNVNELHFPCQQFFPDIPLTKRQFPDISRFSRKVVSLINVVKNINFV